MPCLARLFLSKSRDLSAGRTWNLEFCVNLTATEDTFCAVDLEWVQDTEPLISDMHESTLCEK